MINHRELKRIAIVIILIAALMLLKKAQPKNFNPILEHSEIVK